MDATHYKGSVRVKVGPAVAAFAGTLEVLSLDPLTRMLKMLGKGADKGGSSASMELTARFRPNIVLGQPPTGAELMPHDEDRLDLLQIAIGQGADCLLTVVQAVKGNYRLDC